MDEHRSRPDPFGSYGAGGPFVQATHGASPFRAVDLSVEGFIPSGPGGFGAKYVPFVSLALFLVACVGVGVVSELNHWSEADGEAPLAGLTALFCLAYFGSVFTWIYRSWEFLPPEMRRNASGRLFDPVGAPLLLLVPIYSLYWMFVQSIGLCEAIDAALVQHGKAPAAPRNLAVACSVAQVIPMVNWIAAPVLWLVYMFMVDRAKKQLLAR